jgi:hypothetical protein
MLFQISLPVVGRTSIFLRCEFATTIGECSRWDECLIRTARTCSNMNAWTLSAEQDESNFRGVEPVPDLASNRPSSLGI